jgi:hypothetical protein
MNKALCVLLSAVLCFTAKYALPYTPALLVAWVDYQFIGYTALTQQLAREYNHSAIPVVHVLEQELCARMHKSAALSLRLHGSMFRVERTLIEQREIGLSHAAKRLDRISRDLLTDSRIMGEIKASKFNGMRVGKADIIAPETLKITNLVFETNANAWAHHLEKVANQTISALMDWNTLYNLAYEYPPAPEPTSEQKWNTFIKECVMLLASVTFLGLY